MNSFSVIALQRKELWTEESRGRNKNAGAAEKNQQRVSAHDSSSRGEMKQFSHEGCWSGVWTMELG